MGAEIIFVIFHMKNTLGCIYLGPPILYNWNTASAYLINLSQHFSTEESEIVIVVTVHKESNREHTCSELSVIRDLVSSVTSGT